MADVKKVSLKKLTPKDICGYGIEDFAFKAPEHRTMLYTVYGAADKSREKPSKFDEGQKLIMGRFEAVRLADNVVFEAANLYLPDSDIQEAIANAVVTPDGEANTVEFAYIVGIQKGKSPTGYVWIVDALTDTKTQDALSSVRQLVSDQKLLARFADAMPANVAKLSAPSKK